MRVLLVDPPFRTGYRKYVIPNLGLAYLAGALRDAGHEVAALDGSLSRRPYDDFAARVVAFSPDAIGFSAPTCKIVQADALARMAKRLAPRAKTLVGGTHVSAAPEETMARFPAFDLGFVGEAEASIGAVVEALVGGGDPAGIPGVHWRRNGHLAAHPDAALPTDLSRLPRPAWDLFDLPRMCPMYRNPGEGSFDYPMMTRRGCPYHCLFCKGDDGTFARDRPIDDVIAEVHEGLGRWGADAIMIFDDAFTIDVDRARRLCERFIETGVPERARWNCATRVNLVTRDLLALMKRAGCRTVQFGAESGDQRVLDANRKDIRIEQTRAAVAWCRELGLVSDVSFVFGLPYDDRRSVRRTARFSRSLDPDLVTYFTFVPFPGTPAADLARAGAANLRLLHTDYERYEKQCSPASELRDFPAWRLTALRLVSYARFYLRPGKFGRLRGQFDLKRLPLMLAHVARDLVTRPNGRNAGADPGVS